MYYLLIFLLVLWLAGCEASSVATVPADLGTPAGREQLFTDESGPVVFEKRIAATWAVPLSGLLNLDHPKAKAAGRAGPVAGVAVWGS